MAQFGASTRLTISAMKSIETQEKNVYMPAKLNVMQWICLIRREVERRPDLSEEERAALHVRIDILPWEMIERAYKQGCPVSVVALLAHCETKIGRNHTLELYHELLRKNQLRAKTG